MATTGGKNQHDFFMKVFVDKPGDYSFGWHITNLAALRESYSVNFTVVWFAGSPPQFPRAKSKKATGDEVVGELIGEKQCTGYETEQSITCESCKKGTYVVHVSISHSGELDGKTEAGSQLKHAFTVYGASQVTLDRKVPEYPSLELWNTELAQLRVKYEKDKILKETTTYLREKYAQKLEQLM